MMAGTPAALSGHDFVAIACLSDDDGLKDAVLPDRGRQLLQFFGVDPKARLETARLQVVEFELQESAGSSANGGQEGIEAFAEGLPCHGIIPAGAVWGEGARWLGASFSRISRANSR